MRHFAVADVVILVEQKLLRMFTSDAPVVKSLVDQVLPSTTPTAVWLCGGLSQSGRVQVCGLIGVGSLDNPSVQLFVYKSCSGLHTSPDTPCC